MGSGKCCPWYPVGFALLLFKASADFVIKDPFFFIIGIVIVIVFVVLFRYRRVPDLSSLFVIGVGLIGRALYLYGMPPLGFPSPTSAGYPAPSDFSSALSTLVLPQVVLTIANAILATSLLTKDLFAVDIPPKKFSTSIGLMNLTLGPLRGVSDVPRGRGSCRAAPLRGEDGGANIFAGLIFLFLALFFSSPEVLSIIAIGVLGALAGVCRD